MIRTILSVFAALMLIGCQPVPQSQVTESAEVGTSDYSGRATMTQANRDVGDRGERDSSSSDRSSGRSGGYDGGSDSGGDSGGSDSGGDSGGDDGGSDSGDDGGSDGTDGGNNDSWG